METFNKNRSIRKFSDDDTKEVVRVWHCAAQAAYSYLPLWQSLSFVVAEELFRKTIQPKCSIWVGLSDADIVAFLALKGSYLDRLYVHPDNWRQGWGTRLLQLAKELSPVGLELHTHQANQVARSFYERHGFVAVQYGISPPPESVPDVEYHWRPSFGD